MAGSTPKFAVQVGQAIAAARRASGLTQEDLAERLETAVRNVQRIEAGQNVTVNTLSRIAIALGVAVVELVGDSPAPAANVVRADNPVRSPGEPRRRKKPRARTTGR